MKTGISFDAGKVSRILGLPITSDATVPQASPHEVVVYYGGWSVEQLLECHIADRLINRDDNDDKMYDIENSQKLSLVSAFRPQSGYHRVAAVKLPDSVTFQKQASLVKERLGPLWRPAPAAVALTCILLQLAEHGTCLLGSTANASCDDVIEGKQQYGITVFRKRIDALGPIFESHTHFVLASMKC